MKDDMAGAAAVIATLGVAARLKLPLHVVGLAPCAENLPGGRAQKPSDVFTGMTGKTMEVISTDAEGRMLLADALAYAGRFNPAAVVDIATLTGAQAIALGRRRRPCSATTRSWSPGCWPRPMHRATGCGGCRCTTSTWSHQEPGGRREEQRPAASPASAPAPSSWSTSPRAIPGRTWTWPRWPGPTRTSPPSPRAPRATACGCLRRCWNVGMAEKQGPKLERGLAFEAVTCNLSNPHQRGPHDRHHHPPPAQRSPGRADLGPGEHLRHARGLGRGVQRADRAAAGAGGLPGPAGRGPADAGRVPGRCTRRPAS